jgi:hypothetical protein
MAKQQGREVVEMKLPAIETLHVSKHVLSSAERGDVGSSR